MTNSPAAQAQDPWVRRARLAGQIISGAILGTLLLPALLELASLIGGVAPFKYQGF